MRLANLFQVTGYHFSPGEREFQLNGILFLLSNFPCRPNDLLKHQDLGCPGLGSFLLIPSTPKMGLLVPIIGSTSYSNSIIVDLKIYGALEDKIGYAELSPLKGLLLPIYIERHFFSSTYQEHCAQTEPYFQQLKDKIKSLEISLEHCWQLPETANSPG